MQKGFDGRTTDSDHDWNYFGAVLYAVTLVSTIGMTYSNEVTVDKILFYLGYGHITTKTTQGKIATILYSAFGVPLMMLFVANIGSTMAKMFAFVFTRITMIFCCRMSPKKKRALASKNRQKLLENPNQSIMIPDKELPMSTEQIKSNLKSTKDESFSSKQTEPSNNSLSMLSSTTDIRQFPADIRLNMLTGIVPSSSTSRSLTSSINSIGERSKKDAIIRMNELIRQNSIQNIEEIGNDEPIRRKSIDLSPIQYYINETNKLTSNLDSSVQEKSIEKDEDHMKQVKTPFPKQIFYFFIDL